MVAALGLSACGSDDANGTAGEGGQRTTVATSNDAPFSFTEAGSDTLQGIDGEMIDAIAEQKGWGIEVFTTEFSTLIAGLKAKKADAIVDAVYITDEWKGISFTDPWHTQGEGMINEALDRLSGGHRQVIVETYLRSRSYEDLAASAMWHRGRCGVAARANFSDESGTGGGLSTTEASSPGTWAQEAAFRRR